MQNTGTLKVTTPTKREIVLTRLFDGLTKPELLKRWFGAQGLVAGGL